MSFFEVKLSKLSLEMKNAPQPHYVEAPKKIIRRLIATPCPVIGFNYRGFTIVEEGQVEEAERRRSMTLEEKLHGRR